MTIATRFAADQLIISAEYVSSLSGKIVAKNTITLCKLIQDALPEAQFAVDGRTNEVDYRGRVAVYINGDYVGRTDVDYANGTVRYVFEGPYVGKGISRYSGEGRLWRKDAAKLVQALLDQNCLRGKSNQEIYWEGKRNLESNAIARIAHLNDFAWKLRDQAHKQACAIAFGAAPSAELAALLDAAKHNWQSIVDTVQEDLEKANRELAALHGVQAERVSVLSLYPTLEEVLKGIAKARVQA
jgi:hypothetical protein